MYKVKMDITIIYILYIIKYYIYTRNVWGILSIKAEHRFWYLDFIQGKNDTY